MNNAVKLIIKIIIISLLALAPNTFINMNYDPYGIYRTDFTKQKIEPNQRFIKIRYLVNNPEKYDSFLFGSSRVGNIPSETIPDGKYYNMTISQGIPSEHLYHLKLLLKEGVKMKTVMLGLEDFSYKLESRSENGELITTSYSESTIENIKYYIKYTFKMPEKNVLEPYINSKKEEFPVFYDIYNTGRPMHTEMDEYINSHRDEHIKDKKFKNPSVHKTNYMDQTLKDIGEFVETCKENSINCIVFINPTYKATYLANNPVQFMEFKKRLVEITDFYDFSGINSITKDPFNYYETSHFRVFIGEKMLAKMFDKYKKVDVPQDFGVLVTKKNIGEHIKMLKKQL